MKLEDVPNRKSSTLTERALIAITPAQKEYLDELKRRKKDTSSLMRMLLEQFIKENPLEKAA